MLDLPVLCLVLRPQRIDVIRAALLAHFHLDMETWHSQPMKALFIRWARYLELKKEKSAEYDYIKRTLANYTGQNVSDWVRDYTTFMERSVHMRIKGWQEDKVVDNILLLIN